VVHHLLGGGHRRSDRDRDGSALDGSVPRSTVDELEYVAGQ
jgi:hypothetical protein